MSCEVLNHSHVGDAARERALTSSDHLVHLSEFALFKPTSSILQRWVVTLNMSDRAYEARCVKCISQPLRPRPRVREWFLDQRMHAGFSQSESYLQVKNCRAGDNNVVNTCADQLLDGPEDIATSRDLVGISTWVSDRNKINPLQ